VLVQRGWHYILSITVPLGYSSSFAKQGSGLFWQASNWACLVKDVLRVVDPHDFV